METKINQLIEASTNIYKTSHFTYRHIVQDKYTNGKPKQYVNVTNQEEDINPKFTLFH